MLTVMGGTGPRGDGFIGRHVEREWLNDHVERVSQGEQGRLLLLGATYGMGRRQLIGWLRDRVNEDGRLGVLTLGHRRHAGDEDGGLRGAIEDLMGGSVPAERALGELEARIRRWRDASTSRGKSVGGGISQARLRQIVRYVYRSEGVGLDGMSDDLDDEDGKRDIEHLIAEVTALASCSRPLLVTVGGLERTGSGLTNYLIELMRWVEGFGLPVLLVVSYAEDAQSERVLRALAALRRAGGRLLDQRILAPFEGDAMRALLQRLAPLDEAVSEAVARRTDGNPFYATELVHLLWEQEELEERGGRLTLAATATPGSWPDTLQETLLSRSKVTLKRMPDGPFCDKALRAASVLGEAFDYEVLLRYLTKAFGDDGRCERSIETLIDANLLLEPPGARLDRVHFVHGVLQKGLLESLKPGEAIEYHSIAATALAESEAPFSQHCIQIAEHLDQAGKAQDAGVFWHQSAVAARRDGNCERALELLERANSSVKDTKGEQAQELMARIWLELGNVELRLGVSDRAKVLAARIIQWAQVIDHQRFLGKGLLLLADALRSNQDLEDAVKAYNRAVQVFEASGDLRSVGRSLLGRGATEREMGDYQAALETLRRVAELFGQLDDRAGQAQMYRSAGEIYSRTNDWGSAEKVLRRAAHLFEQVGDTNQRAFSTILCGQALLNDDRFESARECFESVLQTALKDHLPVDHVARCSLGAGHAAAGLGLWETAYSYFRTAGDAYEQDGQTELARDARGRGGRAALRLGREIDAWELLDAAGPTRMTGGPIEAVVEATSWCWAAADNGHVEMALKQLEKTLADPSTQLILDDELAWSYVGLGRALGRGGHPNRGKLCLQRALTVYEALGQLERADEIRLLLGRM